MQGLYRLGVWSYRFATRIAGLFNPKARARSIGAASVLQSLSPTDSGRQCIWMHCASVGEYEQGRPLWDELQAALPEARFILTFFSPSGYEQFVTKQGHGEVYYLPWDTGHGPMRFVGRLYPEGRTDHLALFVKYEWWLGYFTALARARVRTYVVAGAFRQNQPFFRWYGVAWQKALQSVTHVFAQTEIDQALLTTLDYRRVTVAGDPRIDRTLANTSRPLDHAALETWAAHQKLLLVAGSTWPRGERLLHDALATHKHLALLIAPHEVDEAHLASIEALFADHAPVRLSTWEPELESNVRVLIVDNIGLLSRLYRLGQLAYVGGGFGAGIHNTLEAAAYGLPTAVGPNHHKFPEVSQLLQIRVLTQVDDTEAFRVFIERFADQGERSAVLAKAEDYFAQHRGATSRMLSHLRAAKHLPA